MTGIIHLDLPYGSINSTEQDTTRSVVDACAERLNGRRRLLLYGLGPAGAIIKELFLHDNRFEFLGVADVKAMCQKNGDLIRPEDIGTLDDVGLILVTTAPSHYKTIEQTIRRQQQDVPIVFLFAPQHHMHQVQSGKATQIDNAVVDMVRQDMETGNYFKCNLDLRNLRQCHPDDERLTALAEKLTRADHEVVPSTSALIDNVPGPYTTNIQIVDNCNLRCFMCTRRRKDHKLSPLFRHPMSQEAFEAIASAIDSQTTDVFLGGSGEAFMHKDILAFVDYLLDRHKRVHVVSNGTLLSPSLADELGQRNGFDMQLSLDGMTKATYESIRIGAQFEPVIDNFSRLARNVARSRTDSRLELVTVLMRRNIEEFPKVIALANDLGLPQVHGLFMVMEGDAPAIPEESLVFHPELFNDVRQECLAEGERLGVTVSMPEAFRLDAPETAAVHRPAAHELCQAPWTRMDMGIGGYAVCCGQGPGIPYTKTFLAGDMTAPFTFKGMTGFESLNDLYNSEILRRVRRGLITRQPLECCLRCKDQHLLGTGYRFESAFSPVRVAPELFNQAKALFLQKFEGTDYAARMLPRESDRES
jgi:MoaA/NifB/PqqE/SkfB family radical SAM enzyme